MSETDGYCVCDGGSTPALDCGVPAHRAKAREKRYGTAAGPDVPDEPKYGVENGWLFEYVNEHTCGTGRDGYFGAHEPGCGTVPIGKVDDILRDAAAVSGCRRDQQAAWDEGWLAANEQWSALIAWAIKSADRATAPPLDRNNPYAAGEVNPE